MTIPGQKGRVVLITGANSGIGRATAEALANAGATVLLAGRNDDALQAARDGIVAATSNKDVHPIQLDLASLASVRAGAEQVLKTWDRLDVLVNNAGVMLSDPRLSLDGYELTFAVNHLGHFHLTELLLERLMASAPSRIVVVSSAGHRGARRANLEDLQAERSYSAMPVYMRTKLLNLLYTTDLAERVAGSGVSVFAVNPGTVRSRIARDGDVDGLLKVGMVLSAPFSLSPRAGAGATVYAATTPGIEHLSGAYLQRTLLGMAGRVRAVRPSRLARDRDQARQLRQISEDLVQVAHTARPVAKDISA